MGKKKLMIEEEYWDEKISLFLNDNKLSLTMGNIRQGFISIIRKLPTEAAIKRMYKRLKENK